MSDPRFATREQRRSTQFRYAGAWLAGLIMFAVLVVGIGIWATNGSFYGNPPAQTTGQGPRGPITPANPALHENR